MSQVKKKVITDKISRDTRILRNISSQKITNIKNNPNFTVNY